MYSFFRALLLLALLAPMAAHAQERWLFVPAYAGDTPGSDEGPVETLTAPWERGMGGSIANADGATLVDAKMSEPHELSDAQLDQYTHELDQALDQLAGGHRSRGQELLKDVKKLAGPQRDSLRRAPDRAQMLFDACATTAYLLRREKRNQEATQQMIDCLRDFPGLKTSSREPRLTALTNEAQAAVDRDPHGELTVQSTQDACTVRLNGLAQGKTPVVIPSVPIGPNSVQVECAGAPGRIHTIEISNGANSITVDPRLDAAMRTRDGLTLRYASAAERDQFAPAAAAEIAHALRIAHVVLLIAAHNEAGFIVTPQPATRSPLPPVTFKHGSYDAASLQRALHMLQSVAPPSAAPSARALQPAHVDDEDDDTDSAERLPPPPPERERPSNAPQFIAISMAAVGTVALASGWALYAAGQDYRLQERERVDKSAGAKLSRYRVASFASAAAGAALLAGAEFVWVPRTHGIPTWSWIAGGVGAAALIAGGVFAIAGPHCGVLPNAPPNGLDRTCSRRTSDVTFGLDIAASAVPLITLPIAFAIRSAPIEIELTSAGLRLRGTF